MVPTYTYGMYTYGMYTYGMYTYGMYTYGILIFWPIFLKNFFDEIFVIFLPWATFLVTYFMLLNWYKEKLRKKTVVLGRAFLKSCTTDIGPHFVF